MAICQGFPDVASASPSAVRFLYQAARWATFSDHGLHKMGAVVVSNGNSISFGWNKVRSHPRAPEAKPFSIHAEHSALIRGRRNSIKDADMYVARVTRIGRFATSTPCTNCMVLLREAGISSITFINEVGEIEKRRIS